MVALSTIKYTTLLAVDNLVERTCAGSVQSWERRAVTAGGAHYNRCTRAS
ncbi:hypothetical protein FM105_02015 [Brevibacterium yomogidense]|uniref:Uncharacterized protein n=1 Tax=Brevibacterium yomogidense TaxID=946573 RepID=A0A1X6WXU3_9MICO|nr:hypothetical protein FM105_02015 [Brevibacterium yomogidense]